jgi:hypothetical protein
MQLGELRFLRVGTTGVEASATTRGSHRVR